MGSTCITWETNEAQRGLVLTKDTPDTGPEVCVFLPTLLCG